MGLVVSYDEKFGVPSSEVALDSGEHILLVLERTGLIIKKLARPEIEETILFAGSPEVVARVCDGMFDEQTTKTTPPLRMLVSIVVQMPSAAAVSSAFHQAERA